MIPLCQEERIFPVFRWDWLMGTACGPGTRRCANPLCRGPLTRVPTTPDVTDCMVF